MALRTSAPSRPAETQSSARLKVSSAPAADEALDALGALLSTLGRVCFDLGDESAEAIRKQFDKLSQHVLVGTPLVDNPASGQEASGRRDWATLRQLVLGHRKREVGYVIKAVTDLRKTVTAFASAFSHTIGEDDRSDVEVRAQLERLAVAARAPDTAAIRRQAQATIELVGQSIARRSERHRAQLAELSSHVQALAEQLQQAKRAGEIDGLTRVPNRACFDEFLARTTELAAFGVEPLCLFMIDVDGFKGVNDSKGHGAGDAALRTVADTLARSFPRRGDLVARFGGDEFAVVLRGVTLQDARALAQRCVAAMRAARVEYQGSEIKATISVGLADFRRGDSSEAWLARADAGLYRAKQQGRDRWAEASPPEAPTSP